VKLSSQRIAFVLPLWVVVTGCAVMSVAGATPPQIKSASPHINSASPAIKDGGTLTVGLENEPDTLDPALTRTLWSKLVDYSICRPDVEPAGLAAHE
jgi:peptide/nickel transport system substrate-binding protein